MIPDQLLNIAFLNRKPLCMMQSVLNMEPGERLDLCAEIADHFLAFHVFLLFWTVLLQAAARLTFACASLPLLPDSAAPQNFFFNI
jgi:hypothetical protein